MAMALTSYLPTAISALPVAAYCIFFTVRQESCRSSKRENQCVSQIVTSAVYSVIYNGFFHPLANVPGPISAKVFPVGPSVRATLGFPWADGVRTALDGQCALPAETQHRDGKTPRQIR